LNDIINRLNKEINDSHNLNGSNWIKVGKNRLDISKMMRYEAERAYGRGDIKCWFGTNNCVDVERSEELENYLDKFFNVKEFPSTRI